MTEQLNVQSMEIESHSCTMDHELRRFLMLLLLLGFIVCLFFIWLNHTVGSYEWYMDAFWGIMVVLCFCGILWVFQ